MYWVVYLPLYYMCGVFLCPCQSSMPTSSSPVSTPSAWCHVAWEKTHQCILSSAPPWCTQRRLSLSRDASSSSTTPTVSSLTIFFFSCLSLFWTKNKLRCTFPVSFFTLILLVQLIPLCFLYFSPLLPPPCFVTQTHTLSCLAPVFSPHSVILLSLFIRLCPFTTFLRITLIFIHTSLFFSVCPSQGTSHAF